MTPLLKNKQKETTKTPTTNENQYPPPPHTHTHNLTVKASLDGNNYRPLAISLQTTREGCAYVRACVRACV